MKNRKKKMSGLYKVVTEDLKSLGLRNNPTILNFPMGEWVSSPTIKEGKSDDGGVWVCSNLSGAKRLKKYMFDKHNIRTFIMEAEIGKVLFKNSYRLKTDKVRLFPWGFSEEAKKDLLSAYPLDTASQLIELMKLANQ